MGRCCAKNCRSYSSSKIKGISFHDFPLADENLCKQWVKNISRKNWDPAGKYWAKICSLHFKPDDYRTGGKIRRLKPDAIPTVFDEKIKPQNKNTKLKLTENIDELQSSQLENKLPEKMACCVPSCTSKPIALQSGPKSKRDKIGFHQFPTDENVKMEWIKNIHRENWTPSINDKVCSKHFLKTDYRPGLKARKLNPDAVPTVFQSHPQSLSESPKKNVPKDKPKETNDKPKETNDKPKETKDKPKETNPSSSHSTPSKCKNDDIYYGINVDEYKKFVQSLLQEREELAKTAAVQIKPTIGLTQPSDAGGSEQLSDAVSSKHPGYTFNLKQPSYIVCSKQPSNAVGSKQPSNAVGSKQPNNAVGSKQPIHAVGSKRLSDTGGVVQSNTANETPNAILYNAILSDAMNGPPFRPNPLGRQRQSEEECRKKLRTCQRKLNKAKTDMIKLRLQMLQYKEESEALRKSQATFNIDAIVADAEKQDIKAVFLKDMMLLYGKQKKRWCSTVLKHARGWRVKYPECYNYCRANFFSLPCKNTMQRAMEAEQQSACEVQINDEQPVFHYVLNDFSVTAESEDCML